MLEYIFLIYDYSYKIIFTVILSILVIGVVLLAVKLIDFIEERIEEHKYIKNKVNKTCYEYILEVQRMKRKVKRQARIEYRKMMYGDHKIIKEKNFL